MPFSATGHLVMPPALSAASSLPLQVAFLDGRSEEPNTALSYMQLYHLHGKQLHVNFPSKYWKFQPPGVGASPLQRAACHPVSFFRISKLCHLQVTSQISSLDLKRTLPPLLVCVCACGERPHGTPTIVSKSAPLNSKLKPFIRPSV